MRIECCSYCESKIYPGHGITFVRNDAKVFNFCRSKCHSHFKAKHNPRRSKWTKTSRKAAGKEMAEDTVLTFEKRRNRPVKYDRELYIKTIQSMKRIDEIREKRKVRFYLKRMRQAEDKHKNADKNVVKVNKHLLNASKNAVLAQQADKLAASVKEKRKDARKVENDQIMQ